MLAAIRLGSGKDQFLASREWIVAGQHCGQVGVGNVRFGSKADIGACPRDVRFTPESGHQLSAL